MNVCERRTKHKLIGRGWGDVRVLPSGDKTHPEMMTESRVYLTHGVKRPHYWHGLIRPRYLLLCVNVHCIAPSFAAKKCWSFKCIGRLTFCHLTTSHNITAINDACMCCAVLAVCIPHSTDQNVVSSSSCVIDPKLRMRNTSKDRTDPSQLFDDTSAAPGVEPAGFPGQGVGAMGYPGQTLLSDPMSNLAMAYGSSLASQGKDLVDKNVRLMVVMVHSCGTS